MNTQAIIDKLYQLDKVSSDLQLSKEVRNKMTLRVDDFADHFINSLKSDKCFSEKEANPMPITGKKHSLAELLHTYQKEVVETGIVAPSGKHFGYIPAGGLYGSALADFIAGVTNPYAGVHYANPGASTIENEVINWLKGVFLFPDDAVGNLTSGGSVSNLVAFAAARDKYKIKNELIPKSVIYLTHQVHTSAQKAFKIIGLEDVVHRYIPLDSCHRMIMSELEKQVQKDIADGLNPFLVVGTAGTTDTGAVDRLDQIADVAEKYKLWFHVDGAYGGFFILTSKHDIFKGIERADSIIVDPHKSMFIPYGLAAVLIKDKNTVLQSYQYTGNYMQDAAGEELVKSPANLSIELTRHFRGLRLWLPLQLHGIEPFRACLEEKLLLVQYSRIRIKELGFDMGPDPDLSITYFWYPFEKDMNKKNEALMEEIHKDGTAYLSSTNVDGKFVIRMAILSFRSKKDSIDEAVEMIGRCLKRVRESEREDED